MVKAYPSCVGGYSRCQITLIEKCPFEGCCKSLTLVGLAEKIKVSRALGRRFFGERIVRSWDAEADRECFAEVFINGKRFVANNMKDVEDILRWFKP